VVDVDFQVRRPRKRKGKGEREKETSGRNAADLFAGEGEGKKGPVAAWAPRGADASPPRKEKKKKRGRMPNVPFGLGGTALSSGRPEGKEESKEGRETGERRDEGYFRWRV